LDFGMSTPASAVTAAAAAPSSAPPPPPNMPLPPTPPTAAPPSLSSSADMFGGMNIKSSSSAEQPPPPSAPVNDDLLATPSTPTTTTTTTNDMFGALSLKQPKSTEETITAVAPAVAPVTAAAIDNTGASAFSFMNASSAETPQTTDTFPAVPVSATTTPSKASFDPFLSMGATTNTNTNININNMSPSQQQQLQQQQQMAMMAAAANNPQMQAAAFYSAQQQQQQQQMMMMQMQMQMSAIGGNPNAGVMPSKVPVMGGGAHAGGVSTSFAFMDDPAKAKKEKQNKTFDFVKDAMKGAK